MYRVFSHQLSRPILVAILMASIPGARATSQSPAYVPIDLGTLGGPDLRSAPGSVAFALNADGIAAGYSVVGDEDGTLRAFLRDGGMLALDPLPGGEHTMALGINGGADVVGSSFVLGALTPEGARWSGGSPIALGTFEPLDVNDAGTIVGRQSVAPTHVHTRAVMYTGGSLVDLGTLGGRTSVAHAINESGWVAGTSFVDGSATHAFLWNGTMHDLGTLGGTSSQALALNDVQQVVGFADTAPGVRHAALFEVDASGELVDCTDLGELGGGYSVAYDVNDDGQVVGTSDDRAFVWSSGVMVDLNDLVSPDHGWRLTHATAIAPDGTIAGYGWHDGLPRAFLLEARATADLDADGAVDFVDLLLLLAAWGPCAPPDECLADFDGSGDVGFADLVLLLSSWTAGG